MRDLPKRRFGSARTAPTGRALRFPPLGSGAAIFVAVFEYSVLLVGPAIAQMVYGQELNFAQMMGIALIVLAGSTLALRSSKGA
ncbi:hypothetical protein [Pseudophaeobacter sp.]|uniref:hypothetical protein n=1 Tax=Pseudophaeobacter sp. TaxID=1971739 RepID=UPI00329A25BC